MILRSTRPGECYFVVPGLDYTPALIFPFWMRRKTLNSKAPNLALGFFHRLRIVVRIHHNFVSRCFDFKS